MVCSGALEEPEVEGHEYENDPPIRPRFRVHPRCPSSVEVRASAHIFILVATQAFRSTILVTQSNLTVKTLSQPGQGPTQGVSPDERGPASTAPSGRDVSPEDAADMGHVMKEIVPPEAVKFNVSDAACVEAAGSRPTTIMPATSFFMSLIFIFYWRWVV